MLKIGKSIANREQVRIANELLADIAKAKEKERGDKNLTGNNPASAPSVRIVFASKVLLRSLVGFLRRPSSPLLQRRLQSGGQETLRTLPGCSLLLIGVPEGCLA